MKFFILIFFLSFQAVAQDSSDGNNEVSPSTLDSSTEVKEGKQRSIFLGHLLSPSTYTPPSGSFALGSHVTSYSPNDHLMLGSASFLYLFYNSPNLFAKYSREIFKKQRLAIQLDYLKSVDSYHLVDRRYQMEAVMAWLIWSKDFTEFYTLHLNLSYMYFWDETEPHSLRREPFRDHPFQYSLSSLHEVRLSRRFGLASEFGVLGLNYSIPNIHSAISFRYMTRRWLFQFGFSFDFYMKNYSQDEVNYDLTHRTLGADHKKKFISHPEFALQYFF